MTQRFLLSLVAIFCSLSAIMAQQQPLYAQDPEFHGIINPASIYTDFLNHERVISAGISHRSQWGLPNKIAPNTQVARGEYIHLGEPNTFVFGGYAQYDRVGITENFGAYGRFAYVITNDPKAWGISVGLNLGVASWQVKTSRLSLTQIDDPNFAAEPSVRYLDGGCGIYTYKKLGESGDRGKYFYAGLSAPRFFDVSPDRQGADPYRHVYGLAGFQFSPMNDLKVEVSTWVRQVKNIPTQASFNARIQVKDIKLGFGAVSTLSNLKETPFLSLELGYNFMVNDRHIMKVSGVASFGQVAYFGNAFEINVSYVLETN